MASEYKMNHLERGNALLINIENFIDKPKLQRISSEIDVENLKRTLRKLKFKVDIRNDLKSKEITECFEEYSKDVYHRNADCFFCAIMSHGFNNYIVAADNIYVYIKDLINYIKMCKSLIGKPKLFFIQACREEKTLNEERIAKINLDKTDNQHFLLESERDILIHYATIENYVSYRGQLTGSFFINALCEVFDDYGNKKPLSQLLLMINEKVSKQVDQVSIVENRLRGEVYFEAWAEIFNNLSDRIEFIGRSDTINQITQLLMRGESQAIILAAIGGNGKTCLANEYGHLMKERIIVRWFSAESKEKLAADYRSFAKLLNIDTSKMKLKEIIERVNGKLNSQDKKFLFILDDVVSYNDINEFIINLPKKKVKILMTTRNSCLTEKFITLQIDSFSSNETEDYISKNLKRKINDQQKAELIELVKVDDRILPLKLSLTVKFLNENFAKKIDFLFKKIKMEQKTSKQVETYLFDNLKENFQEELKILAYCSHFDPDLISYTILTNLIETTSIETRIDKLASLGMLEKNQQKEGVRIHRLIQAEMKGYMEANRTFFESHEAYLKHIILKLNECVEDVSNKESNKNENNDSIEFDFIQVEHILNEVKHSRNERNFDKFKLFVLRKKLALFYYYYAINYESALKNFKEIYDSLNGVIVWDHTDKATSLSYIGLCYNNLGDHRKALEYLIKSFKMILKLNNGKHNLDLAASLTNIATTYKYLGNIKQSLNLHKKAFEMHSKFIKEDNHQLALSLTNIGVISIDAGDFMMGLKHFEEAYAMQLRLYKDDENHSSIAQTVSNIGSIYSVLSKSDKCLEYQLKAYNILNNLYRDDHPDTAIALNNLGTCCFALKKHEEALNYKLRALEMFQRLFKGDHHDIALALNNVGDSYSQMGENQKGIEYKREAFEMRSRLFNQDHPQIAASMENLGKEYINSSDLLNGLNFLTLSHEMRLRLFDGDHPVLFQSMNQLGDIYAEKIGDKQKALDLKLKAFKMLLRFCKDYYPRLVKASEDFLKSYGLDDETNESKSITDSFDIAFGLKTIGMCKLDKGENQKALRYLMESNEMYLRLLKNTDHVDLLASIENIAICYDRLNDKDKALEYKLMAFGVRSRLRIRLTSIFKNLFLNSANSKK